MALRVAKAFRLDAGYAAVRGGRVYYEVQGAGHPLVLIHAGFLDRRMWDGQFELFARSYRVVHYDVRGFGESDRPQEKYSDVEDHIANVSRPKEFNRTVVEFLAGVDRRSTQPGKRSK